MAIFRALPENVDFGPRAAVPPRPTGRIKAYPDNSEGQHHGEA